MRAARSGRTPTGCPRRGWRDDVEVAVEVRCHDGRGRRTRRQFLIPGEAAREDITTPLQVSVLYVDVPPALRGGRLVLARGKKHLGRVAPEPGLLVAFDGDLLHGVERVESPGKRLSLVCEQYALDERELAAVPDYRLESRAKRY